MNLRAMKRRAMPKRHNRRFYGKRCSDYFAGCLVCDYWRFKDESGRFPYSGDELRDWQIASGITDESGSVIQETP